MKKKSLWLILIFFAFVLRNGTGIAQDKPDLRVEVNMVQLNVAVTDKNGKYITGLKPKDFTIVEDGIMEKTATFAEGDGPAHSLSELAQNASGLSSGDIPQGPTIHGQA